MARATKASAAKEPGTSAGRARKQAVVVIHGMGEQRPLETLRSFVESVYQRDVSTSEGARPVTNDPDLGDVNQVWVVPDDATGTAELRRISTPRNKDGLRTDFFEFYWADIMEGTPLDEVYGWVSGLIIRSPWSVPRSLRVWLAWLLLWAVSLLFVLATLLTLDPSGVLATQIMGGAHLTADPRLVGSIFVVVGLAIGAARFTGKTPRPRVRVLLPLATIAIGLAFLLVPPALLGDAKVWTAVLAVLLTALLNTVSPYIGDVARYVRATPKTIERRRLIRERGLDLLEHLHGNDPTTGTPIYERIVVVAHSLGTIVGYDLIQLLWEKEGPTHHHPAMSGKPAADALAAVDAFVKASWVDPPTGAPFDIAGYQQRQAAVSAAIAAAGLKFRITDFITLGAALTHADFLMADDQDALKRNFEERLISSSPPRPDWPQPTMIYRDWAQRTGPAKGPFIHFAAPFASVRWTNIFDEHWLPLLGDIVSGPLTPLFGPGIDDKRVAIKRPGLPAPLDRLFTHTEYWTWHESYAGGKVPLHIQYLRDAIGF